MEVISQIHSNVYSATYEPKLQTKESNEKKDDKLKDSVALSNEVSAKLSGDNNSIAALKKLVESQADIRAEKVSVIKTQIENGTYAVDDKIDAISDSVIDSMLA